METAFGVLITKLALGVIIGMILNRLYRSGVSNGAKTLDALCARLEPIIDAFHQSAFAYSDRGGKDNRDDVDREAVRIIRQIRGAKKAGIELKESDAEWVNQLELSAQAIIELTPKALRKMSEEEALDCLAKIEGWFRIAAVRCAELRTEGSEAKREGS